MKIDRRDAGPLERREEAASSRELQDHCQGKHQGEPDASEARSRTCERAEVVSWLQPACVLQGAYWCESGGFQQMLKNGSQQRC